MLQIALNAKRELRAVKAQYIHLLLENQLFREGALRITEFYKGVIDAHDKCEGWIASILFKFADWKLSFNCTLEKRIRKNMHDVVARVRSRSAEVWTVNYKAV